MKHTFWEGRPNEKMNLKNEQNNSFVLGPMEIFSKVEQWRVTGQGSKGDQRKLL